MTRHRAVVFDLDGTLLDTLEDIGSAANRVLAAHGAPQHAIDDFRSFIGEGVRILFERALPAARRDADTITACVAGFRSEYAESWNRTTRRYDGVPQLLDTLADRDIRLSVLSNKPHAFTCQCVQELLSDWTFDLVLGQREGIATKPDPVGALEIAAFLKLPPVECLYVGDTGVDMQTAVAAGMMPIGVLWGFRDADELKAAGARELVAHPLDVLQHL